MDPEISEKPAPSDPWQNLCYMLEKYRVIAPSDNAEEEAKALLLQGEQAAPPDVIDIDGERIPYRRFPRACRSVINSCVKFLEKGLENQINGGAVSPEAEKMAIGAMCLADNFFEGACTSPDGKFSIHQVNKANKRLALNPHGRWIKQLAAKLEKYRSVRLELAKQAGASLELPPLSCTTTVMQDIRASLAQWSPVDPETSDGSKPWEMMDSLDSLKENLGVEAVSPGFSGSDDTEENFEEKAETHDEIIDQQRWLRLPEGSVGSPLFAQTDVQRGNILSRTPKAWIWNYAEDPLQFAVDYVCDNAKPCLEEAHNMLVRAGENRRLSELGSQALILDSQNKNNPDSFWKVIKRISENFSSSRGEDPEALLRKLDCARFTVCLKMTNLKLGINPDEFQRVFQEKIHKVLADPKRRETVTRNELLMETLTETDAGKTWGTQQRETWLEHLQTAAIGAYENSVGMEAERKRLLDRLNHLFKTPREELERTQTREGQEEIIGKIHGILTGAADAFYTYLSGKTGQMTRRELRTKIYALKTSAEKRGKHDLAERLSETGRFISSISSQIKSGEWYSRKEANKQIIFNFLATMLECPKSGALEFPGSKEPDAKDPLQITCDFLRAVGTNAPMGGKTIAENLDSCREYEEATEGGQIAKALRKVTKNLHRPTKPGEKANGRGREQKPVVPSLLDRRQTLGSAIETAEKIHGAKDPLRELYRAVEQEIEVLRTPQTLDAAQNERFEKNLYFWKGLCYLTQNIQSRKEDERFQVSSTGKATLQNLISMANAKLRNKEIRRQKDGSALAQFSLTKTRERSLLSNLVVPLALWLAKETKGVKTKISHEEFVGGLREKRAAAEILLQVAESDQDIERKTEEFRAERERAKRLTNSFVLEEIISTLENPQDLAKGLTWEMENPTAATRLVESHPELDTPNKRWAHLQNSAGTPKMEGPSVAV